MALILAILYFGLIELLMLDSSRELAEARKFRARIVALTLAENGAELAALSLVTPTQMTHESRATTAEGTMFGRMDKKVGGVVFDIKATGETTGVEKVRAEVRLLGRIEGAKISIDFAMHTQ